MRCFWDDRQRGHAPAGEFFNGAVHLAAEHGGRVDAILAAVGTTEAPVDLGIDPLLRIHSADYLDFLRTAHDQWRAAGREGDAFPYTFPVVGRRPLALSRIDALLGQYSFDTSSPIAEKTWEAAYWAAQTALAATDAVLGGARSAFAVCRPPGHHCGRDYLGGYSYLSNAAIAAEQAIASGRKRVAILDVDYHHGNGTQQIFWRRGDVFYASIHADPARQYPFFLGHANERGEGDGAGETLNLPQPVALSDDGFLAAVDRALGAILDRPGSTIVVSLGFDTYGRDPIGDFALTTPVYHEVGRRVAAAGRRLVILQEGGYYRPALGDNAVAWLRGAEGR